MTVTTELTPEQSRKICFDHIANQLIVMKQYLNIDEFNHYKFVINKMGSLVEISHFADDFDRAWPQDLVWGDL